MSNPSAITSKGSLMAAVLAAIGASTCCAGPFVLLSLGIGGSWIGNLSLVEPYRPFLIAITLVFLGLAFRRLYLSPAVCADDKACALPVTRRKQRVVFWVVSGVALAIVGFPWYGVYVFD